jgi:hypothetical protein
MTYCGNPVNPGEREYPGYGASLAPRSSGLGKRLVLLLKLDVYGVSAGLATLLVFFLPCGFAVMFWSMGNQRAVSLPQHWLLFPLYLAAAYLVAVGVSRKQRTVGLASYVVAGSLLAIAVWHVGKLARLY